MFTRMLREHSSQVENILPPKRSIPKVHFSLNQQEATTDS